MSDNKLYNIHGKAYGEYKDAFIRTFTVTAEDEDGTPVHLNAIHQMVCLDNHRFFESLMIFGEDFFDDGVLAYDIDLNGCGWDASDFDIVIRELVADAILGKGNYKRDTKVAKCIRDSVDCYITNDGGNDVVRKAMWHYTNVA